MDDTGNPKKELGGFPMKELKEMDFTSLKNNFDEICDEINSGSDAVSLSLRSGRKDFILPEENYDSISRFVMLNTSAKILK